MKISKKSVNGGSQVSGGFIFDQMDRFAHDYWKKELETDKFLFTAKADITFYRQICNWDDVKLDAYSLYDRVVVRAIDENGVYYAWAEFTFIEKDHAYCDTKGGE